MENKLLLIRQPFHGKREQNDSTIVSSRLKHLLKRNTSQVKGGKRGSKETLRVASEKAAIMTGTTVKAELGLRLDSPGMLSLL